MAPFGARALRRMLDDGLPQRAASPLRFLFDGRSPASVEAAASRIESLRAQIAARDESFRFVRSESAVGGAVRLFEPTDDRSLLNCRHLATSVSVPRRWGVFLHLCAQAFEARVILEMGACVGVSGAYLASAPSHPYLVTLEGSPALAAIAQETLSGVSANADVVVGTFEETLPLTLQRLGANGQKLDMAFVDGHHDKDAVRHYVNALLPHLSERGVLVLDDIHLYEGMWQAWQELSLLPGFVAVNVGRFGLLLREGEGESRRYDLSPYTGRWRVGAPREVSAAERPRRTA